MLTTLAKRIDKALAQLRIATVEHCLVLTVGYRIERGGWQLGLNIVIDMAKVQVAMTGQLKQMAFAVVIQVMKVTDNKNSATGQYKLPRFF